MNIIRQWLKLEVFGYLLIATIVFSIVVFFSLFSSLSKKSFEMPTNGMRPTIVAGDKVIVDMDAYSSSTPRLNDLAVFFPIDNPEYRWIFRIVGIPGDSFTYEGAVLKRNGVPVVSPAFSEQKYFGPVEDEKSYLKDKPLVLSKNEYFFLSDDPDHFNDSRSWGPIPKENILGKVTNFN